jgi:hypothetical protein
MRVCMSDVDETRCQLGLTRWSVPKFILLQQLKRSSERNAPRAGSFPELRKQIAETAEQVKDQGIWCYVSFYHVLTRSTLFRTRGRRSNPSMTKPGQTRRRQCRKENEMKRGVVLRYQLLNSRACAANRVAVGLPRPGTRRRNKSQSLRGYYADALVFADGLVVLIVPAC